MDKLRSEDVQLQEPHAATRRDKGFGGNGAGCEDGLEGMGIHPTTWLDSKQEGFEWRSKGTVVWMHDWYVRLYSFSIRSIDM